MTKRDSYSGYTADTAKNLLLDAGAFFINFDIGSDDFDTAVAAGKLLGATRGGGSFSAVPEIRAIEVDGVHGKAKGLQVIDEWEIKMNANVLEVTKEGLSKSLTASEIDSDSNPIYDIISAKNYINLTDYYDNITYVGKISGSDEPLIIQIYNAINTTGLTLETEDKSEAVTEMEFEGHYDETDLDSPPFKIFYPKAVTDRVAPTVSVAPTDGATDVDVTESIVWTFDEAIRPNDVRDTNFFVTDSLGAEVVGALTIGTSNTVVTLKPTSNLGSTETYTAIATKSVRDIFGNNLESNSVTKFTTI